MKSKTFQKKVLANATEFLCSGTPIEKLFTATVLAAVLWLLMLSAAYT